MDVTIAAMRERSSSRAEGVDQRALVERCRLAEPDAFREVYQHFAPELFLFLRRLLGERAAAEDALQETFVRLHGARERLDPARPLRPYLLRIARNVGIGQLRRRRKLLRLDEELARRQPGGADPRRACEQREKQTLVREALASLEPEPRSALLLRHHHGLSVRELGDALGTSERTARTRLREAATHFERALRERGVFHPGGAL